MAILYFSPRQCLASIAGLAGHGAFGGMCCMFFLLFPVATLVVGLYNGVYLIALRGYSIGQGVVHIKVVDASGNLLTQGRRFVRLVVRVGLSFVAVPALLDMLWPLWDERGQTPARQGRELLRGSTIRRGMMDSAGSRSPLPAVVARPFWSMPRSPASC